MSVEELLDRIEDLYDIEDILYIIGKDKRWLLKKLQPLLIKHREDFGDSCTFINNEIGDYSDDY